MPCPDHLPSIAFASFAMGPMTAIRFWPFSGSTFASFFSKTIDSAASCPTISRLSLRRKRSVGLLTGVYGCSNSPMRSLTSKILPTASSTSFIRTAPSLTSCFRYSSYECDIISMSMPAFIAYMPACLLSFAMPWLVNCIMAAQSETTKPLKFHRSFSTSRIVYWLAVPGTPLISLNELITLRAPASTHILYGSR